MATDRYSASTFTSAAPALNTPFFEFRNGATAECLIKEIICTLGAATQTNVALHRATAQGSGGNNAGTIVKEGRSGLRASTVSSVVSNAFSTAPTYTAAERGRRIHLPAAIGAGFHWAWPEGTELVVPVSASLLLVADTVAGAAIISTTIVWAEL